MREKYNVKPMNWFPNNRTGLNRADSRSSITFPTKGLLVLLLVILVASFASPVLAQTYSFSLDEMIVEVFWESDGTMSLDYVFVFSNDPGASPIDFVDVGMHNDGYDLGRISATIDGQPITHIQPSEYVDGAFELGLGANAIPAGQTGTVMVRIEGIKDVLYTDSEDPEYASGRFSPTWFDSGAVHGSTDTTVIYHLPPGVLPEEPKWHAAPGGFPDSPSTGLDQDGRIVYEWRNTNASGSTQYEFGASFPKSYVPAGAIVTRPSFTFDPDVCFSFLCFGGVIVAVIGIIVVTATSTRKRKLNYLPPKIAIEGHGIKRGLTAVEAAILLETPLDRVLTMLLFSVVKKGAARVEKEDPLTLVRADESVKLRDYEEDFVKVMIDEPANKRRSNLQKMMVRLVKSVQKKMEGFSLKETREYYKSIIEKAWKQVEEAATPEVKSEKFDEGIEWTMLDRDFDGRTRRTFHTGPVFVPSWWWHVRPSTPAPASTASTVRLPSGGSKTVSLPTLPGSTFAASVVTGVQNSASNLVSNVIGFTNGVTKTTNPPPLPSTRSSWSSSGSRGGGGCACACACACAGCACACAGGGR